MAGRRLPVAALAHTPWRRGCPNTSEHDQTRPKTSEHVRNYGKERQSTAIYGKQRHFASLAALRTRSDVLGRFVTFSRLARYAPHRCGRGLTRHWLDAPERPAAALTESARLPISAKPRRRRRCILRLPGNAGHPRRKGVKRIHPPGGPRAVPPPSSRRRASIKPPSGLAICTNARVLLSVQRVFTSRSRYRPQARSKTTKGALVHLDNRAVALPSRCRVAPVSLASRSGGRQASPRRSRE